MKWKNILEMIGAVVFLSSVLCLASLLVAILSRASTLQDISALGDWVIKLLGLPESI